MIKIGDKDVKKIYVGDKPVKKVMLGDKQIWPSVENTLASATLTYVGGDGGNYWAPATSLNYTLTEEGNYEIDCEFIYTPKVPFNGRAFSQIEGETDYASWYLHPTDDPGVSFKKLNIAVGQKAVLKMYAGFQFTNTNQQLPSSFSMKNQFYDADFVGTVTCNLLRVEKVANIYSVDNAERYMPDELTYI